MEFLRHELDDPGAEPCGRCMKCTGTPLRRGGPPQALRVAAREHLRGFDLFVEPRKQWPSGLAASMPKGRIAEEERPLAGRALSVMGDGGWGRLVATGRGEDERFADELVTASAALIRERWRPEPAPTWVTCVPSMTHPDLVPDFAARLADALDLPFHEVVRKVGQNQPQAAMQNSAQQVRNVWDAFEVVPRPTCRDGPVLLVDDLADSKWTLTVVARALPPGRQRPRAPVRARHGDRRLRASRQDSFDLRGPRAETRGHPRTRPRRPGREGGSMKRIAVGTAAFGFVIAMALSAPGAAGVMESSGVARFTCTITGTGHGDTIHGTSGRDVICGKDGNDLIYGGGGADILSGGGGTDLLMGQVGADVLLGGNGNDNLWGGLGRDALVAGFGRDIAVGQQGLDIIAGGTGDDICLSGIDHQAGDRIRGGPGHDRGDSDAGDSLTSVEDPVTFRCYGG